MHANSRKKGGQKCNVITFLALEVLERRGGEEKSQACTWGKID